VGDLRFQSKQGDGLSLLYPPKNLIWLNTQPIKVCFLENQFYQSSEFTFKKLLNIGYYKFWDEALIKDLESIDVKIPALIFDLLWELEKGV